jgi:hypothetical protein
VANQEVSKLRPPSIKGISKVFHVFAMSHVDGEHKEIERFETIDVPEMF